MQVVNLAVIDSTDLTISEIGSVYVAFDDDANVEAYHDDDPTYNDLER